MVKIKKYMMESNHDRGISENWLLFQPSRANPGYAVFVIQFRCSIPFSIW